jgi:lipid-A-disaccharide synthase
VAAYKPHQAQLARQAIDEAKLPAEIYLRKTAELMQASDCCMACSGSVSLELLYHKKPTVVLYWISPFAFWVQQFFRRVKYITLVNLLTTKELFPVDTTPFSPTDIDAERVPFPEYLTSEDKSAQIASHVIQWLANDDAREGKVAELAKLKARVGHAGASETAAGLILKEAELRRRVTAPKPHFRPGMQVASSGRNPPNVIPGEPKRRQSKAA